METERETTRRFKLFDFYFCAFFLFKRCYFRKPSARLTQWRINSQEKFEDEVNMKGWKAATKFVPYFKPTGVRETKGCKTANNLSGKKQEPIFVICQPCLVNLSCFVITFIFVLIITSSDMHPSKPKLTENKFLF